MSCGQALHIAESGSFSILIAEEIEAYETQLVVFDLVLSICFGKLRCPNSNYFRKERTGDSDKAR